MKKFSILLVFAASLFLVACNKNVEKSITDYVNPFIGTGGHGHTFPGATLPFGMMQLSPDSRLEGWDGCSGYHYSDSMIYGFSHTHLSGTGVGDYADILFMPVVGTECLFTGYYEGQECGFGSSFSKDTEEARPGYYSVVLDDYKIKAELTTSYRSGIHKYTFPKSEESNIILDLAHRDKVLESSLEVIGNNKIQGLRRSSEWANNQYLYFVAEFSKDFKSYSTALNDSLTNEPALNGNNLKAIFRFDTEQDEEIMVRIAISAVSIEGAEKNLNAEIDHWDFDKVKNDADSIWTKELSKIEVKGGTEEDKTVFYTGLYHSMIAPNLYSDVDSKYRGRDLKVHEGDHDYYTVFSLWDTYRATHPLFTIIDEKRTNDFINTFLKQYQQGGRLPVWELAACETECMIGYHSVSAIADAYMKGIRDYNTELALEAMQHSAMMDHFGLEAYKKYGYIPADHDGSSVSKTLEYAYDDWCIATMAKDMGKEDVYKHFIQRAQYYRNIWEPETGFFRAKANNIFVEPFDAKEVNFHLTEANTWQYTFYVPQDVTGMMNLMGGEEGFVNKLDELFTTSSETSGRHQADITGLIGQYAHGNEPSHHMAYLYAYAGAQWKSAEILNQIMTELYSDQPDGLSGNEDCGQMSSWYVLSSMGFYPVCPGNNEYVFGRPIFDEVIIHLENGNDFVIKAKNNSKENMYIESVKLNGEDHLNSYFTHQDIMNGGTLEFTMSDSPNAEFAKELENRPNSTITDNLISAAPYFKKGTSVFFDEQTVEIASIDEDAKFIVESSNAALKEALMAGGSYLMNEIVELDISAVSGDKAPSLVQNTLFSQVPHGREITIAVDKETGKKYAAQYSAGGDKALIDYQRGAANYMTGYWQGYEGMDLEAVIKLEKETQINKLAIGMLQDQNAWIFMPVKVHFYVSMDGENFKLLKTVDNTIDERYDGVILEEFETGKVSVKANYIKIVAENRGVCPEWHKGAGNKSWIFTDEIVIN